jgi:2',3'-cyclic-nucleotide 2'-phosphodiesterase (5'-nucleotidase family)
LVIEPGPIRIKDIYGMYRYENFLYVVELTGQQIKDFLEYCAKYYVWDGKQITPNPEMRGYNYDMAEGIKYTIDVTRKPGNRIENLVLQSTDKSLKMNETYKVAMNSYRATGGGGHMAAAGASDAKIIWKSSEEMRNILADYIKKTGKLTPHTDGNWKVVE